MFWIMGRISLADKSSALFIAVFPSMGKHAGKEFYFIILCFRMYGICSILLEKKNEHRWTVMSERRSGYRKEGIAVEKAELRTVMIARRCSLPEYVRIAMSEAIAAIVTALPEVIRARAIQLYLPMAAHAEVSTTPLVDALSAMDKQLLVPVVQQDHLVSALYRKGDILKIAEFGQPEPDVAVVIDESHLDVVLIPLLAFDRKGYRIGYGKGFYDRFLLRLSAEGIHPFRIGLAYSMQMVDEVPADPWDEPLDGVVHEHGIIRFTKF
jgi:5-formyltetrahydrofolate cyclo-ligase